MDDTSLEKSVIDTLLKDRRRDRFWRNIRFFCFFMLVISIFIFFNYKQARLSFDGRGKGYVSLVSMYGVIDSDQPFSAETVVPELRLAFKDKRSKGVVLMMDSPGGSPAQSSIIHDQILFLKEKYHKKVIVVAGDYLASGGYLVASAADKIYVDKNTITGSIGVISSGFGFNELIQKVGVGRRVYTAGNHKDRLDPFMTEKPEDIEKLKVDLEAIHANFIQDVVQGRGDKLKGPKEELFSGDHWIGNQAVRLGLADGTGSLWSATEIEFKTDKFRNYTSRPNLLDLAINRISTSLNVPIGLKSFKSKIREELY